MHERKPRRRSRERRADRPRRLAHEDEEERRHRRNEELPRRRARQLERRVRPARTRCERDHPDLGEEDAEGERGRTEDAKPELEREHERERREHARLVLHDGARIDAREPRDEREPAVPERERVARVQASVLELVDRAQRERAEVVELAHPAEMEERVALDDPLDAPERDPEAEAGERDGRGHPRVTAARPATAKRERRRTGDEHEHERERQRRRGRRT